MSTTFALQEQASQTPAWTPDDLVITEQAACLDVDPHQFFSDDMTVVAGAKRVCADCPVREACLAAALRRREPHGVWGGELFDQGVVIERKRPRGRPRKHPLPTVMGEQPQQRPRALAPDERRGCAA